MLSHVVRLPLLLRTLAIVLVLSLGTTVTSQSVSAAASHCFTQTGFCVSDPTVWDYFVHRGAVRTFGYPISNEFWFEGANVQMFQRAVVQIAPNGNARFLNLLDTYLPYTQFNGATFPGYDAALVATAPDPTNQAAVLAWVAANAPDGFSGMPVNFYQTWLTTVRPSDVGVSDSSLLPGFALEMWGIPTSTPLVDPNNHKFVYQRFQRGIMMYDADCQCTQGVLLADYLKSVLTGRHVPADLVGEAADNQYWLQYWPALNHGSVRDSDRLPSTDFTEAFTPTDATDPITAKLDGLNGCSYAMLASLYPDVVTDYGPFMSGYYLSPTPRSCVPYGSTNAPNQAAASTLLQADLVDQVACYPRSCVRMDPAVVRMLAKYDPYIFTRIKTG